MRRGPRLTSALFLAMMPPLAVAACNGVLGIDAPNVIDPDASSSETGTGDGPSDESAVSLPSDGGVDQDTATLDAGNFLKNGDMELTDCMGWDKDDESLNTSKTAHFGMRSCMVCSPAAGPGVYGIGQRFPTSRLKTGVTYDIRAFVQAPDGDAAVSTAISLQVYQDDNGSPANQVFKTTQDALPLDRTWQQLKTSLTYQPLDAGLVLGVSILNRDSDLGCFLVDDVTFVERTP